MMGAPMPEMVNIELLRVLGGCIASRSEATIVVAFEEVRRSLHIARSELLAVDSNFGPDRLGEILVAEGKLDPALVSPMAAEASRQGRLFASVSS
jgi:hypothetical protein